VNSTRPLISPASGKIFRQLRINQQFIDAGVILSGMRSIVCQGNRYSSRLTLRTVRCAVKPSRSPPAAPPDVSPSTSELQKIRYQALPWR